MTHCCENCNRPIAEDEAIQVEGGGHGEPRYTEWACVHCTPGADDPDRRDWDWERDRMLDDGEAIL